MSGFAIFNPSPNGYVEPTNHYIVAPGIPLPTNSWSENAVKGTVTSDEAFTGTWPSFPPEDRHTKPFPWIVSPYYGDGNLGTNTFISLGHATVNEITHSTVLGDNELSISPKGLIDRMFVTGSSVPLSLINLDDGSATYLFEARGNVYVSRGSPFINIGMPQAGSMSFLFASNINLTGPSVVDSIQQGNLYYAVIPFSVLQTTQSITSNFPVEEAYNLTMPVWNRYTQFGTIQIQSLIFIASAPEFGRIFLNNVLMGEFTLGVFNSSQGAIWDSINQLIFMPPGINLLLSDRPRFTALYSEIVPGQITFIANGTFSINITDRPLVISYSGSRDIWVSCNETRSYYTDASLGYVTNMIAKQVSPGGIYDLTFSTLVSTSIYMYTPRWWRNNYNITGISYLGDIVHDVTYGDCILANVNQSSIRFTPKVTLNFPLSPIISMTALNDSAFSIRIVADTAFYNNMNIAAYTQQTAYIFGQNAAKYGRILVFAHIMGVLLPPMYTTYINLLESWLNGL
jgi:hypothetical protein